MVDQIPVNKQTKKQMMDESGGEIHKVYKNAFILWSVSVIVNGFDISLWSVTIERKYNI